MSDPTSTDCRSEAEGVCFVSKYSLPARAPEMTTTEMSTAKMSVGMEKILNVRSMPTKAPTAAPGSAVSMQAPYESAGREYASVDGAAANQPSAKTTAP